MPPSRYWDPSQNINLAIPMQRDCPCHDCGRPEGICSESTCLQYRQMPKLVDGHYAIVNLVHGYDLKCSDCGVPLTGGTKVLGIKFGGQWWHFCLDRGACRARHEVAVSVAPKLVPMRVPEPDWTSRPLYLRSAIKVRRDRPCTVCGADVTAELLSAVTSSAQQEEVLHSGNRFNCPDRVACQARRRLPLGRERSVRVVFNNGAVIAHCEDCKIQLGDGEPVLQVYWGGKFHRFCFERVLCGARVERAIGREGQRESLVTSSAPEACASTVAVSESTPLEACDCGVRSCPGPITAAQLSGAERLPLAGCVPREWWGLPQAALELELAVLERRRDWEEGSESEAPIEGPASPERARAAVLAERAEEATLRAEGEARSREERRRGREEAAEVMLSRNRHQTYKTDGDRRAEADRRLRRLRSGLGPDGARATICLEVTEDEP